MAQLTLKHASPAQRARLPAVGAEGSRGTTFSIAVSAPEPGTSSLAPLVGRGTIVVPRGGGLVSITGAYSESLIEGVGSPPEIAGELVGRGEPIEIDFPLDIFGGDGIFNYGLSDYVVRAPEGQYSLRFSPTDLGGGTWTSNVAGVHVRVQSLPREIQALVEKP